MTPVEYMTDFLYARLPQPRPTDEQLKNCKIIAHRGGEHDNKKIFENTLETMERSSRAGVWGIEFDIRWTRDVQPVVIHDTTLKRVFNLPHKINKLTLKELRSMCPLVPTLEEVVALYGKYMHLMIEIKTEEYKCPITQNILLDYHLKKLKPCVDYHIISTNPKFLKNICFVAPSAFMSIGGVNTHCMSNYAIKNGFGGNSGWYMLINENRIKRHHEAGQNIGTGWIASKNSLFREINRRVDWIFSNHAQELQHIISQKN